MENFICVQCGTQFGETVEPPSRCLLMQGLAMLFGASRGAWFAACVDARRAFRSGPRVSKPARHRDHRHARHFDGTAGPCIGAQSLGCYHRTRALRRESFCFVLFSRAADVKQAILPARGCAPQTSRQDCLRHVRCLMNRHRFKRRESNRYSTGLLILIFLKSGCLGFNKKFISLALSTLGTARATDFPARTHSSPICIL